MALGKGLGRGLNAIFNENDSEQIKGIRLADIEPRPDQPRRNFDEEALAILTESIRQNGIITPITVRRTGETYQIIAGERRWRAARAAGLTEIPAHILDADEAHAYELALIENLQREDLNPIEEAEGYRTLIDRLGLTQEQAADKVGVSRPAIANALRLLSLPEEISKKVENGELSAGHARTILGISDKKLMMQACNTVIERDLSVRETEALVKSLAKPSQKSKKVEEKNIYVRDLMKRMSEHTEHRIIIHHGIKKGKLTIEYFGNEDLDRICEALKKLK